MRMEQQPDQDDSANKQGNCDQCGAIVYRHRGQDDISCDNCGAIYNCFGQRLRDDLYTRVNPSSYYENIGDMEGDEMSYQDW